MSAVFASSFESSPFSGDWHIMFSAINRQSRQASRNFFVTSISQKEEMALADLVNPRLEVAWPPADILEFSSVVKL